MSRPFGRFTERPRLSVDLSGRSGVLVSDAIVGRQSAVLAAHARTAEAQKRRAATTVMNAMENKSQWHVDSIDYGAVAPSAIAGAVAEPAVPWSPFILQAHPEEGPESESSVLESEDDYEQSVVSHRLRRRSFAATSPRSSRVPSSPIHSPHNDNNSTYYISRRRSTLSAFSQSADSQFDQDTLSPTDTPRTTRSSQHPSPRSSRSVLSASTTISPRSQSPPTSVLRSSSPPTSVLRRRLAAALEASIAADVAAVPTTVTSSRAAQLLEPPASVRSLDSPASSRGWQYRLFVSSSWGEEVEGAGEGDDEFSYSSSESDGDREERPDVGQSDEPRFSHPGVPPLQLPPKRLGSGGGGGGQGRKVEVGAAEKKVEGHVMNESNDLDSSVSGYQPTLQPVLCPTTLPLVSAPEAHPAHTIDDDYDLVVSASDHHTEHPFVQVDHQDGGFEGLAAASGHVEDGQGCTEPVVVPVVVVVQAPSEDASETSQVALSESASRPASASHNVQTSNNVDEQVIHPTLERVAYVLYSASAPPHPHEPPLPRPSSAPPCPLSYSTHHLLTPSALPHPRPARPASPAQLVGGRGRLLQAARTLPQTLASRKMVQGVVKLYADRSKARETADALAEKIAVGRERKAEARRKCPPVSWIEADVAYSYWCHYVLHPAQALYNIVNLIAHQAQHAQLRIVASKMSDLVRYQDAASQLGQMLLLPPPPHPIPRGVSAPRGVRHAPALPLALYADDGRLVIPFWSPLLTVPPGPAQLGVARGALTPHMHAVLLNTVRAEIRLRGVWAEFHAPLPTATTRARAAAAAAALKTAQGLLVRLVTTQVLGGSHTKLRTNIITTLRPASWRLMQFATANIRSYVLGMAIGASLRRRGRDRVTHSTPRKDMLLAIKSGNTRHSLPTRRLPRLAALPPPDPRYEHVVLQGSGLVPVRVEGAQTEGLYGVGRRICVGAPGPGFPMDYFEQQSKDST